MSTHKKHILKLCHAICRWLFYWFHNLQAFSPVKLLDSVETSIVAAWKCNFCLRSVLLYFHINWCANVSNNKSDFLDQSNGNRKKKEETKWKSQIICLCYRCKWSALLDYAVCHFQFLPDTNNSKNFPFASHSISSDAISIRTMRHFHIFWFICV